METTAYNKLHIINNQLREVEEAQEKLELANKVLKEQKAAFDVINNEIVTTQEIMILSIRDYLKNVIEFRMAFAREVIHIVDSTRELNNMSKILPTIDNLVDSITKLDNLLDEGQDLVPKLKKIFNLSDERSE